MGEYHYHGAFCRCFQCTEHMVNDCHWKVEPLLAFLESTFDFNCTFEWETKGNSLDEDYKYYCVVDTGHLRVRPRRAILGEQSELDRLWERQEKSERRLQCITHCDRTTFRREHIGIEELLARFKDTEPCKNCHTDQAIFIVKVILMRYALWLLQYMGHEQQIVIDRQEKQKQKEIRHSLRLMKQEKKELKRKARLNTLDPIKLSLRWQALVRDNFTCQYCGRSAPSVKLHVDHIVPKSKGGEDTLSNYLTSCQDCNLGKKDSMLLVTRKDKKGRVIRGQIPSFFTLSLSRPDVVDSPKPETRQN